MFHIAYMRLFTTKVMYYSIYSKTGEAIETDIYRQASRATDNTKKVRVNS